MFPSGRFNYHEICSTKKLTVDNVRKWSDKGLFNAIFSRTRKFNLIVILISFRFLLEIIIQIVLFIDYLNNSKPFLWNSYFRVTKKGFSNKNQW